MVDALDLIGDEGRGVTAISFGEVSSNLWTGDFRMGKPTSDKTLVPCVKREERTWGSETSQYPEEKKPIGIPLVAASEQGEAQTMRIILYVIQLKFLSF